MKERDDLRGIISLLTRQRSATCAAARADTREDVAWTDITCTCIRSRSSYIISTTRISSTTPNEPVAGIGHGRSGGERVELFSSELGYVQFKVLQIEPILEAGEEGVGEFSKKVSEASVALQSVLGGMEEQNYDINPVS